MDQSTRKVAVNLIDPDPEQPRKDFDEAALSSLAANLKAIGQLVAVILLAVGERFVVLDGERRWRAANLAAITHLNAVVLTERPSAVQLRIMQMSLDAHRKNLSAIERCDFLHKIKADTGWSVSEMAANLHMAQPVISKLMGLARLPELAREALNVGKIDIERACVIAAEANPERQLELLNAASGLSREGLRRKARGVSSEPKASSAKLAMPGGFVVALQGGELTLSGAIDVLTETVKQLKKGLSQGLDISTVQAVLRDQAKAGVK